MLSNSLDSIEGTFACISILLVAELLLEGVDGSRGVIVSKRSVKVLRVDCDRRLSSVHQVGGKRPYTGGNAMM